MHAVPGGSTILVIEHDPQTLSQLVQCLTAAEHRCLPCSDLDAAQAQLRSSKPDLIIAELNLAGQHGAAVCTQLFNEQHLDPVPMMFLSATQVPDVVRSSDAGGAYYLRKPADATVLIQLVATSLSVSKPSANPRGQRRPASRSKPSSAAASPLPVCAVPPASQAIASLA